MLLRSRAEPRPFAGSLTHQPGQADYIMDTFPTVMRRDLQLTGEYRTKRLIGEAYDAMAKAIDTGEPHETAPLRSGDQPSCWMHVDPG